jgi:hypothetical protein
MVPEQGQRRRARTVSRHRGDAQPGNGGNGRRILAPLAQELNYRLEMSDCPPEICN